MNPVEELNQFYNKPNTPPGAQIYTRVVNDFLGEKSLQAKLQYPSVLLTLARSAKTEQERNYASAASRYVNHMLAEHQSELPENIALADKYAAIHAQINAQTQFQESKGNQMSNLSRFVTDKTTPALEYIERLRSYEQRMAITTRGSWDDEEYKFNQKLIGATAAAITLGAALTGAPIVAAGAAITGVYGLMLKSELKYRQEMAQPETTFTLVRDDLKARQASLGLWESIMVKLGQRNQEIERQAHLIVGQAQQERDADPHQTIRNFVPLGLSNERQPPVQPSILDVAEIEHGRHERQRG